jgi:hypothetical protein
MGEWKAPLSLRVRQALRAEMEEFAARERRTLGNLGELLVEWSFAQLKVAGSMDRLLKVSLTPRTTKPKS